MCEMELFSKKLRFMTFIFFNTAVLIFARNRSLINEYVLLETAGIFRRQKCARATFLYYAALRLNQTIIEL